MENEIQNIIPDISAGKTVSEFIKQINDNFETISTNVINNTNNKQNKIVIAKDNDNIGTISVKNGVPTGGSPGDIVIIYEE